jgi:hypothetical protein
MRLDLRLHILLRLVAMLVAPRRIIDACHSRDALIAQFEQQSMYFELGEIRKQVNGRRGCGFGYSVSNERAQFG